MTHYYSEKQDSALKLFEIPVDLLGQHFEIISASGVFSSKKLDKGTELLIKSSELKDGSILDLGCGCGVVGVTVAKAFPKSTVTMSDVNKRAIKIARMNVAKQKLTNVTVLHCNLFEKTEGEFDTILLNPPQNAGKDVCFSMIEGSKEFLKKKGTLQLVARHNKGGKQLSEKMNDVFGNVDVLDRKSGFRVYISVKSQ